jgi:hypothetical protein
MLKAAKRHLDIDFKTKQAKCEAFQKMFDADSLYDRDQNGHWKIKRETVNARLAQLVDSFPSKGPKAPEYFSQLLLEEVAGAATSCVTLEAACRQLVRTKPFFPAIAEVLKALKEQSNLWCERWSAHEFVDNTQEELREAFTKAEKKLALEKGNDHAVDTV